MHIASQSLKQKLRNALLYRLNLERDLNEVILCFTLIFINIEKTGRPKSEQHKLLEQKSIISLKGFIRMVIVMINHRQIVITCNNYILQQFYHILQRQNAKLLFRS